MGSGRGQTGGKTADYSMNAKVSAGWIQSSALVNLAVPATATVLTGTTTIASFLLAASDRDNVVGVVPSLPSGVYLGARMQVPPRWYLESSATKQILHVFQRAQKPQYGGLLGTGVAAPGVFIDEFAFNGYYSGATILCACGLCGWCSAVFSARTRACG